MLEKVPQKEFTDKEREKDLIDYLDQDPINLRGGESIDKI